MSVVGSRRSVGSGRELAPERRQARFQLVILEAMQVRREGLAAGGVEVEGAERLFVFVANQQSRKLVVVEAIKGRVNSLHHQELDEAFLAVEQGDDERVGRRGVAFAC